MQLVCDFAANVSENPRRNYSDTCKTTTSLAAVPEDIEKRKRNPNLLLQEQALLPTQSGGIQTLRQTERQTERQT